MGKRCLVALDTDHIKQYVFATDKLKEIRGASSVLDTLNRRVMLRIADEPAFQARRVYTNGGSGLFLIEKDWETAAQFGQRILQAYRRATEGGAFITFAVEEIPDSVKDAWNDDIGETLELLRFNLAKQKNIPPDTIALPSHPFLHVCDACGARYSGQRDDNEARDNRGRELRYCSVCMTKRDEDGRVKDGIDELVRERLHPGSGKTGHDRPFLWEKMMRYLKDNYQIFPETDRPSDFDALSDSGSEKEYLALIYADGNSMGQMMGRLKTLAEIAALAKVIDDAVYQAMGTAISDHLPVRQAPSFMFPFDILLIGGDDIMIATPASVAFDVACTLAKEFYTHTQGKGPGGSNCSLSVGVVFAPVKYPFGPLHDLAESALKFAKKVGAKRQQKTAGKEPSQVQSKYGETLINFITVRGSTSPDFERVYQMLHDKKVKVSGREHAFYATLRPYTVEGLEHLLDLIREGKRKRLGRTKLHQIREAVLRMNLSSSVYEGKAVLRNWRSAEQRDFVRNRVYATGNSHAAPQPAPSEGKFQQVTFPWFADGRGTYRTALLDYVELYDFVPQEEGDDEA